MKKALLIAAVAATLSLPSFVALAPASAAETVAQSSMTASDSAMKPVMDKLHDQMSTMTSTGNTDKDYASIMKMLGAAMKSASEMEMKMGKDPKAKESAKQVYDRLFGSNQNYFSIQ